MKIPIILILLALAGCAQNSADSNSKILVEQIETALDGYATEVSSKAPRFELFLEQGALESANQTQELVASMGLVQLGQSYFSQTRLISADQFETCLDVSGTSFVYENGDYFPIGERLERQLVRAQFVERLSAVKISLLQMVGEPC